MFEYIAISGTLEDRYFEYVKALHEHFEYPSAIKNGCFVAPEGYGLASDYKPASESKYEYPNGSYWVKELETVRYRPFHGIMAANFTPMNKDGSINYK